ncbi:hypothetical protein [Rahnella sp. EDr1-12]|uniref:hypothetical protein n=1 Tax=unclassified Rahnella TaxID=2635087 RepID=UPI003BAA9E5F
METSVWIVGAVILISFIIAALKPRRCDVCNIAFKRKYYTWELEGKKQHFCPGCNGKMERKISKERFKKRFG